MVQKSKHSPMLFDDTPRGLLEALLIGGGIVAALTFAPTLFIALAGIGFVIRAEDRERKRKIQRSFQYLVRKGYAVKRQTDQGIRVELTTRGRSHAQRIVVRRALLKPISRPKTWDRKWRMILFDIPAEERIKRNAFRSLISRLGAVMLQKSVWVYPFDCSEQIGMLRDIFKLSDDELRLVLADSIGDDRAFRRRFGTSI